MPYTIPLNTVIHAVTFRDKPLYEQWSKKMFDPNYFEWRFFLGVGVPNIMKTRNNKMF